jgi:mono/diheme cytochrome c family protein
VRGFTVFVCSAFWILAAASSSLRAGPAQATATGPGTAATLSADQALVQKYCVTCHNSRARTGGLSLEGMNPADAGSHAEVWE